MVSEAVVQEAEWVKGFNAGVGRGAGLSGSIERSAGITPVTCSLGRLWVRTDQGGPLPTCRGPGPASGRYAPGTAHSAKPATRSDPSGCAWEVSKKRTKRATRSRHTEARAGQRQCVEGSALHCLPRGAERFALGWVNDASRVRQPQ